MTWIPLCKTSLAGYIKTLPVNQDNLWDDIAEVQEKIREQVDLFNKSKMHVCSMHVKYALDRVDCVMVCYTDPENEIFWIADIYKVD